MSCRALLLLVPALGFARAAAGQSVFHFEPLRGELSLGYDGRTGSSPGTTLNAQRLDERLTLRLNGSAFDPGIAMIDLAVRPGLAQDWWSGTTVAGTESGRRSSLFGDGRLTLFRGKPLQFDIRGFRSEDIIVSRFEQRTESDVQGLSASGILRTPLASFSAVWDLNRTDARWTSAVAAGERRLRDRNELDLQASTGKTRLHFERLEVDDLLLVQDEYVRWRFRGTNDQRWGKGSRLQSRFDLNDRGGIASFQSRAWSQQVHLQHAKDVETDIGYHLSRATTDLDETSSWGVTFAERVRPAETATLSLAAVVEGRNSTTGSFSGWHVNPRGRVALPLAAGFRLDVEAGAGYRHRSRESSEDGGFGTVIGEAHTVPVSGRFLLDQANADPMSVRVSSAADGILLDLGLDYHVNTSGAFVEVTILPGGRLLPDDEVTVDYRFELLPTASGALASWEYDVSIGKGGFLAYHSFATDEPIGVEDSDTGILGETDNATAGLRLDTRVPLGTLRLAGEWRRTAFEGDASTSIALDGNLAFQYGARWRGRIGGAWSTRRDETRYTMVRGLAQATWRALPRLNFTAELSASRFSYSGRDGEAFIGVSAGTDWVVGRTSVSARIERNRWDRSASRDETRLVATLRRSFG